MIQKDRYLYRIRHRETGEYLTDIQVTDHQYQHGIVSIKFEGVTDKGFFTLKHLQGIYRSITKAENRVHRLEEMLHTTSENHVNSNYDQYKEIINRSKALLAEYGKTELVIFELSETDSKEMQNQALHDAKFIEAMARFSANLFKLTPDALVGKSKLFEAAYLHWMTLPDRNHYTHLVYFTKESKKSFDIKSICIELGIEKYHIFNDINIPKLAALQITDMHLIQLAKTSLKLHPIKIHDLVHLETSIKDSLGILTEI